MFQMKQNVSVLLEIQRYSDQGDQSRYSLTGKNANDGKERGHGKPLFCQDQIDKYGGENGPAVPEADKERESLFFCGHSTRRRDRHERFPEEHRKPASAAGGYSGALLERKGLKAGQKKREARRLLLRARKIRKRRLPDCPGQISGR